MTATTTETRPATITLTVDREEETVTVEVAGYIRQGRRFQGVTRKLKHWGGEYDGEEQTWALPYHDDEDVEVMRGELQRAIGLDQGYTVEVL